MSPKYSSASTAARIYRQFDIKSPLKLKKDISKIDSRHYTQSVEKHVTFESTSVPLVHYSGPITEFDDVDIENHMKILRKKFPKMFGLQETIFGEYRLGSTIPKFDAIPNKGKFVQILNQSDHWVCITNVFSQSANNIYIYDSMFTSISQDLIFQTSCLLREFTTCKDGPSINFSVRKFQNQTRNTRLCGLYSVAVAIATCQGVDLSGCILDEQLLCTQLHDALEEGTVAQVPFHLTEDAKAVRDEAADMLYCFCRMGYLKKRMVRCYKCHNWFHFDCVQLSTTPPRKSKWLCFYCSPGVHNADNEAIIYVQADLDPVEKDKGQGRPINFSIDLFCLLCFINIAEICNIG